MSKKTSEWASQIRQSKSRLTESWLSGPLKMLIILAFNSSLLSPPSFPCSFYSLCACSPHDTSFLCQVTIFSGTHTKLKFEYGIFYCNCLESELSVVWIYLNYCCHHFADFVTSADSSVPEGLKKKPWNYHCWSLIFYLPLMLMGVQLVRL